VYRTSKKYNRLSVYHRRSSVFSSELGTHPSSPPKNQAGFSMIEALVAILILAIGLLGLAFLQAQGLKFNTSAYARTQASILASDIIDRMRINAGEATVYATTSASGTCDPTATTVQNDITCWSSLLAAALPGGSGSIADLGGNAFTITVSWQERLGARLNSDTTATSGLVPRNVTWRVEL
jgi:type IV pilus assembly protein PilV